MKHIYDPEFKYTKSHDTDIRKTFARIRREQAKAKAAAAQKAANNVVPLKEAKHGEEGTGKA